MKDYSGPEYKNLYEEILLDYHYRFPKFHPIHYHYVNEISPRGNQPADAKTLRSSTRRI